MVRVVREIKVTVYVDSNKDTHEETYEPQDGESLSDLLRRLTEFYDEED